MAKGFLNNGTATGSLPVGNGKVVVILRGNTPDFPANGYEQFTGSTFNDLISAEPDQAFWKIAAGPTMVVMTAAEKASVQAAIAASNNNAATAAAAAAARKTASDAALILIDQFIITGSGMTAKEIDAALAKIVSHIAHDQVV